MTGHDVIGPTDREVNYYVILNNLLRNTTTVESLHWMFTSARKRQKWSKLGCNCIYDVETQFTGITLHLYIIHIQDITVILQRHLMDTTVP